MESIRTMAVAGSFYPLKCNVTKHQITAFNKMFEHTDLVEKIGTVIPKAAIVPHAGYVFSGYTSNIAYRFLSSVSPKRIIVIGPSHRYYFKGISGSFFEAFQTPCGNIEIDSAYLFPLARRFNIRFTPQAHLHEHSTEVQMPFIRYYFPHTKVIELVYGDVASVQIAQIITALLHNPDNIVIISSDLSHFYPQKKANRLDRHCINAVKYLDINKLQSCEACGISGIKAMIIAAKAQRLSAQVLHYTTSADYSPDTSSVVGYMSALFY